MANNKSEKNTVINRRAFLLLLGKLGLLTVLSSRLFYLQILQFSKYEMRSKNNRIKVKPLIATRGKILDCCNNILAYNAQFFQLMANRRLPLKEKQESLDVLFNILNLSIEEQERICRIVLANKAPSHVVIMRDIPWNKVVKVEENANILPGISINVVKYRVYTHPLSTAHILGYTAKANDLEKENLGIGRYSSQYVQTGKIGIEKSFENELKGQYGLRHIEVNASGAIVRELGATLPIPGDDLILSINIKLQNKLYGMFGDYIGAAILTEIDTGKVKALVSAPGYDINAFPKGINSNKWNDLMHHPQSPLYNRALKGFYSPGAIFYIVTILAALEAGIPPTFSVYCGGSDMPSNTAFNCNSEYGHGNVDMLTAIQCSCSSYIASITKLINYNDIIVSGKKLGFWSNTIKHLQGELIGCVPTPERKRKNSGVSWVFGDTLNVAVGQGYITATPLQLARMVTSIAHGKRLMQLSITMNEEGDHKNLDIAAEHIKLIQQALEIPSATLDDELYSQELNNLNLSLYGKSITHKLQSKFKSTNIQEMKNDHNDIFVGFISSDVPKYAVSVVIEHGGQRNYTAASIGRRILLDASTQLNIR